MLLIIREMQIKTAMRYHLIQSEWLSSKSLQTITAGEGMEKREPSYTVVRNVNLWTNLHTATMDSSMKVR